MSLIDKTLIDLINLADYHTKISAIIEANKNNLGSLIIELSTLLENKQDSLKSGTNIKTINGQSLLGSGDITIESSSNENCVHTYPNGYDFGFDISQVFDLAVVQEFAKQITYSDWEANPNDIIYDWDKICEFIYNVQDNSIITYNFDAFGGDKQLLFIDVNTENVVENTKEISIISISTYNFNPITIRIIMTNVSDFERDTRLCQFEFIVNTDENIFQTQTADTLTAKLPLTVGTNLRGMTMFFDTNFVANEHTKVSIIGTEGNLIADIYPDGPNSKMDLYYEDYWNGDLIQITNEETYEWVISYFTFPNDYDNIVRTISINDNFISFDTPYLTQNEYNQRLQHQHIYSLRDSIITKEEYEHIKALQPSIITDGSSLYILTNNAGEFLFTTFNIEEGYASSYMFVVEDEDEEGNPITYSFEEQYNRSFSYVYDDSELIKKVNNVEKDVTNLKHKHLEYAFNGQETKISTDVIGAQANIVSITDTGTDITYNKVKRNVTKGSDGYIDLMETIFQNIEYDEENNVNKIKRVIASQNDIYTVGAKIKFTFEEEVVIPIGDGLTTGDVENIVNNILNGLTTRKFGE